MIKRIIRACLVVYVGNEMSETCKQSIASAILSDPSAQATNPSMIEFTPNEFKAAHAAVESYFGRVQSSVNQDEMTPTKRVTVEVRQTPKFKTLRDIFGYLGKNPKDVREVQLAISEALDNPKTRRATIKILEEYHDVSRCI